MPTGYSKDYGQAYETARGFGWVAAGHDHAREPERARPGAHPNVDADARLDTFVLMQNNPQGDWQVAAPDGTYQVTYAVGDVGVPSTAPTR